jgi:hypothetical protein
LASQPGLRRPRQIGRPLADLVVPTLGKTLAARGFAAADVVLAWPQIMGERLADVSEPIELQWPRGAKASTAEDRPQKAATLIVRVEGAHGLDIQHMAPLILERVNAYFGWRCADKLVIRQGRVTKKLEAKARPAPPDAEALAKGRKNAAGIEDDALRTALAGLGAEVFARRSSKG